MHASMQQMRRVLLMILLCDHCSRDLNAIWQDNMSHDCDTVICEDCSGHTARMRKQVEPEISSEEFYK